MGRPFIVAGACVCGSVAFLLWPAPLLGQTAAREAGAVSAPAPRTPWGAPDLQGTWTSEPEFGVPFERPARYGTRQFLTDEEYAERIRESEKRAADAFEEIDVFTVDTSNAGAVGSPTSPPPHWLERSTASRRTSLVIDPPDGRIPPLTPQAQARVRQAVRGSFGDGPYDSPADFTLYDRCITRGIPTAMFPAVYNATTSIVQSPDSVAITYEMIHETRIILLDGRPPAADAIRGYMGMARGWWEGDTLVVETTNFNGRSSYRGSGAQLRMVERFRRVDADTLDYQVTLHDPDTWAAPWTAALTLAPRPEGLFEYACHEGNHAMRNMLSIARAAERREP